LEGHGTAVALPMAPTQPASSPAPLWQELAAKDPAETRIQGMSYKGYAFHSQIARVNETGPWGWRGGRGIRCLGKVSPIRLSRARFKDAPFPALPTHPLAVRVSPASVDANPRVLASAIPPWLRASAAPFDHTPEP